MESIPDGSARFDMGPALAKAARANGAKILEYLIGNDESVVECRGKECVGCLLGGKTGEGNAAGGQALYHGLFAFDWLTISDDVGWQ
jgi:hypothetical protein